MRRLPWFVLPLLIGCGIVSGPSPADPTCAFYDESHVAWVAVGSAASGLAGATGVGGMLASEFGDEEGWDIGLAVTSAAMGALALTAELLAGHYVQRWNENGCGSE